VWRTRRGGETITNFSQKSCSDFTRYLVHRTEGIFCGTWVHQVVDFHWWVCLEHGGGKGAVQLEKELEMLLNAGTFNNRVLRW